MDKGPNLDTIDNVKNIHDIINFQLFAPMGGEISMHECRYIPTVSVLRVHEDFWD